MTRRPSPALSHPTGARVVVTRAATVVVEASRPSGAGHGSSGYRVQRRGRHLARVALPGGGGVGTDLGMLPRARLDRTAPAPLAPLHLRDLPAARQVSRPGQHPLLPRCRSHRTRRSPRRVRISRDQLHNLRSSGSACDTFHRPTLESQQARRIIATVNHGPRLSSRCSKTQRGSRSCGPPSFRRAEQAQPQVARSRSKSRQTRQTPLRRPRHAHRRPTLATRNLVARREDLTRYKSGTFQ